MPRFAVGGKSGLVQVWDYNLKVVVTSRVFESGDGIDSGSMTVSAKKKKIVDNLKVRSLCFSSDGELLGLSTYPF